MPAIRIIDDHVELANIGTNTHAQIDSHIANPSAHHTKYTDAEAVTAVLAADDYLKNTGDTSTGTIKIDPGVSVDGRLQILGRNSYPQFNLMGYNLAGDQASYFRFLGSHTTNLAYLQIGGVSGNNGSMDISGMFGNVGNELGLKFATTNLYDSVIKDPKNHAVSALSGTKKLVEINIGGASYYFEVYPTKA